MPRALLLCALAGAACGKHTAPAAAPGPGGAPAASRPPGGETVASLDLAALEPVESIAAHCEGAHCHPTRTLQATLARPAPPFEAAVILDSVRGAMEDTGYVFVQTAKGWFVGEFLWSLEEGELWHRVRRFEVIDYLSGGSPELLIVLEKRFLDSEQGPVMHRTQEVVVVCAVDGAGTPACVDPDQPMVLSSRAEDASWRVEVSSRPDGTLDRKAVEGTPPAGAVGPVRIAAP